MLIALLMIGGSASAGEYITTHHDWITSSHTIVAGDSAKSPLTDTSNYQWYNITGSEVNIRYRFKKDTVLTAGVDTRSVFIVCTPQRHSSDSGTLYTTLYTGTDASPTAAWEWGSFLVSASDSASFWNNWKVFFVNGDSVTQAQETALLGNTYADSLEIWIEERK